jgi:dolichyl-phosphate-mannose-protein mannosyltransferase
MTQPDRLSPRSLTIGIILITIIGALLRIYWLANNPPNGDELYTVADAFDYMTRGHSGLIEWHHPKLRNIIVYCTMMTLGANLEGLRFASITIGILMVPLTALVARQLTKNDSAALLAALFMATDSIHIMFSRQSMQEVYMPFFLLLGMYLTFRYMESRKPSMLIFAGIFFGLGLASKWMGLAIQLFLILMLLIYRDWINHDLSARDRATGLLFYVATLVVLPVTIYFLSYYPWSLNRGYSFSEWLSLQKVISIENFIHKGENSYIQVEDNNAALWFIRPIGFADFMMENNTPTVVLGLTNPLVWLLTLPAVGYLIYNIRKLNWQHIFLLAVFICSYAPLALTRRVTAANSSLGIIPFAFMLVASVVMTLSNGRPNGKKYLFLYLSLVFLAAIPLYLMIIGKGYGTILQPLYELYRPLEER